MAGVERAESIQDLQELHGQLQDWREAQERRFRAWEEDLERREFILAEVKQGVADLMSKILAAEKAPDGDGR